MSGGSRGRRDGKRTHVATGPLGIHGGTHDDRVVQSTRNIFVLSRVSLPMMAVVVGFASGRIIVLDVRQTFDRLV